MRAVLTIAVGMVLLTLHGCGGGGDDPAPLPGDGAETVQIGFRMRLFNEYNASRSALPSDYDDPSKYEQGTGFENYICIDGNDFCFILFDGKGKYVQILTALSIELSPSGLDYTDYTVLCAALGNPGPEFRIVVLANWGAGNYPAASELVKGVTTIDDVCSAAKSVYSYSPSADAPFAPSAATPIPMYGVKTCAVTLLPDIRNDIGVIYLLRAMAKIEVRCNPNNDPALELESVKMDGYNTRGFCAPVGMTDNTGYVSSTHIPESVAEAGAMLDFTVSPDRQKAVIYVPEYRNTPAPSGALSPAPCRLIVTFADNTERQFTIRFATYTDGVPTDESLDVLRNVLYRFTVSKSEQFEVTLKPYGVVDLNPDFGLDVNQ